MTNCSHAHALTPLNDTGCAGFCTQWGEPVRGNQRLPYGAAGSPDGLPPQERIASLP